MGFVCFKGLFGGSGFQNVEGTRVVSEFMLHDEVGSGVVFRICRCSGC